MKQYTNGLYVSIENHDDVHDYEFLEGEILYLSDFVTDEELGFVSAIDGGLNFRVNGVNACCTPEQFEQSFAKLDMSSAWFEFQEDIDVLSDFLEFVMSRESEDTIQLSDIKYNVNEDLISGLVTYITEEDMFPEIRNAYTRVLIPRTVVRFVAY